MWTATHVTNCTNPAYFYPWHACTHVGHTLKILVEVLKCDIELEVEVINFQKLYKIKLPVNLCVACSRLSVNLY